MKTFRHRLQASALTGALTCMATGCIGFVDFNSEQIEHPSPPPPQTPLTEGYVRIWTTAKFQGLYHSWDNGTSRTKFKKLLVTVQFNGHDGVGPEIPVLAVDMTGSAPSSESIIDKDLGRLAYVKLDSEGGSGADTEPRLILKVRAVPETAADYIDAAVAVGRQVLEAPLGQSITNALAPGASTVIADILDVVGKQASKYKDKEWSTTIDVSVKTELDQNNGLAAWILIPTDPSPAASSTDGSLPTPGSTPDSAATVPTMPPLVACDVNGKAQGRMTHVCEKDASGAPKKFDRYAWVTMKVEVLREPAANLVPEVSCPRLGEADRVAQDIETMRGATLSQTHRQELDAYIALYESVSRAVTADGVAQISAYVDWLANKGPRFIEPTTPPVVFTPTWSTLQSRINALKTCAEAQLGTTGAKFSYVQAESLHTTTSTLTSQTAPILYTAVSALDIVLAEEEGKDDSPLVNDLSAAKLKRDRKRIERALYSLAFPSGLSYQDLKTAIETYPRCGYCATEGKRKLEAMQPPTVISRTHVPEAESIDALVEAVGVDPTPLATARASLAHLETLEASTKGQTSALTEAEDDWKRDAEAAKLLLSETLGVSKDVAEAFVSK